MNENEIRKLFGEMKGEPLPVDSLARVRLGLARRREKRKTWFWLWPAVLVVAGLLAILFVRPAPKVLRPPMPRIAATHPVPPPQVLTTAPLHRVVHHARSRVAPPPGTVVRIETNDPTVVILLVGE